MSEFFAMEDWDLQSVVRGCAINDAASSAATLMGTSPPCFTPSAIQQDDLLCDFPDFLETTTVLDELELLYNPFYPVLQPISPTITAAAPSISNMENPNMMKEHDQLASSADNGAGSHGAKSKKRWVDNYGLVALKLDHRTC